MGYQSLAEEAAVYAQKIMELEKKLRVASLELTLLADCLDNGFTAKDAAEEIRLIIGAM